MLKLKGKYAIDLEYHKDASALVVPKTAMEVMVNGKNLIETLHKNTDKFDFCCRAKVPRSNKLVMRFGKFADVPQQKITRFFISTSGGMLIKIAPSRGIPGEFKRANKLTDEYFKSIMDEIGLGVWDERIHTKNQNVYDDIVETGICAGYTVTECNNMKDFDWSLVNYDWYEKEINKLIIGE